MVGTVPSRMVRPASTYFLWLDLGRRSYDEDAAALLERACGVRLMSGSLFGADGRRWARRGGFPVGLPPMTWMACRTHRHETQPEPRTQKGCTL